jgi:hypothetical protein
VNDSLQILGTLALALSASFGAAYAWTALRRKPAMAPQINTVVRFRSGAAVYRSVFLGETKGGWLLSAPLQRDHHVPVRVGEELRCEIVTAQGIRHFRSEVLERSSEPWRLLIRRPGKVELRERRDTPRRKDLSGLRADIDGETAVLVDLSDLGARVASAHAPIKGERLRVDLPWLIQPQFAYVLDVTAPSSTEQRGVEVRLRFEEPLPSQPATRSGS